MGLNRADLFDVMSSHLGDPGLCERDVVARVRLQAIDGMVLLQQIGQVAIEHGFTVTIMNQEQRRFVTPLSDQDDRVSRRDTREKPGKLLDGGSLN